MEPCPLVHSLRPRACLRLQGSITFLGDTLIRLPSTEKRTAASETLKIRIYTCIHPGTLTIPLGPAAVRSISPSTFFPFLLSKPSVVLNLEHRGRPRMRKLIFNALPLTGRPGRSSLGNWCGLSNGAPTRQPNHFATGEMRPSRAELIPNFTARASFPPSVSTASGKLGKRSLGGRGTLDWFRTKRDAATGTADSPTTSNRAGALNTSGGGLPVSCVRGALFAESHANRTVL